MQNNFAASGADDLLARDKENIWHPFTPLVGSSQPILISSASGVYLHTRDGRKIIDAISSWWVNLHGHANPVIAEAIAEQANILEHVIFAGFTHEPAITLSQNLLSILPENQSKIFFSDNGSTAVEVALKISMQYWVNKGAPRKKIIAFANAYHGDTFGAMSVGGRSAFTNAFEPFLFAVEFIDIPTKENFEEINETFKAIVSTGEVAAFIFEPLVQAAAGMIMYDAVYLDLLMQEAKKHDVICIADEVFTGFGRTGKLFASDYLSIKPDIMAISKGITGGTLPLGVTSCSAAIQAPFVDDNVTKTFFHGHSYTANPLTCAVANASFRLLMDDSCQKNIQRINQSHKQFLSRITDHKNIKLARCLGTILAIEVNTASHSGYFNEMRHILYTYFISKDILLRPLGNVIYIVPPYIISAAELQTVYNAIEEFLNDEVIWRGPKYSVD